MMRLLTAILMSFALEAQALDLDQFKKKLEQAAPALRLVQDTPLQEEIEMGRQVAGSVLGASPLVKDTALQGYINNVGRWLAIHSDRADMDWHFAVIDSPDVNAFAAPGGYIMVTQGLYALLENESELAGVLAHEIAHVTKRHHLTLMKKSQMIQWGGDALSKELGERGKLLVANGAEIMARGLDKDAEFEADRMGVVLATRAGYDPYGLPAVLQKIAMIKASDNSVSLLFKTHPHPDARLARLDTAMGTRFDTLKPSDTVTERFYRLGAAQ